jgi:hypothetical protein
MRAERNVSAKSEVAKQDNRRPPAEPAPVQRHGLARAIYIAAIAVATIGWLWLIGWIALKLT